MSLQTLIDRWHAYQGMETRFVEAYDMLAFHVDRFFRDDTGAVQRLDTGIYWDTLEVHIPFWTEDQSMMGFTQSYIITSAVVHAGHDRAGHQQATLASPNGWYLTDDAVLPLLWDAEAAGREKDIVIIWLVRNDKHVQMFPASPETFK